MSVVLIVEDEILEQEFLESIISDQLGPHDFLLTCGDGLEAVRLAKEHRPDIIFMDIRIPEIDGIEAIGRIRQFLPNALITILSAYSDFSYAQKAVSLRVFEYLLKPVKPSDFLDVFKRMLEELKKKPQNNGDILAAETDSIQKNTHQGFLDDAIKYIDEHFLDKLTLQMVASKVFVNPKYLSHVFKKEKGVSFTEYVSSLKIKKACELLETTDYPAYRISIECGFSDPSYFNRVFYSHMNMTPQAYRKFINTKEEK